MKEIISTKKAPGAVGAYSQAVVHNDMIYLSGQICIDPDTGEMERDSVGLQTRRTLQNVENVLIAAGSGMDKVLKCNIYISSMDKFEEMDNVYKEFFADSYPARVTVAVSDLYENLDIEIDVVAYKD
ncbi:2-iminobutanoate/2-iminopropanoate deaminase [Dethiosulfatibacter aminovorans DSM 17477]|uniref:2-iminobutanoate/2-iminopropanoate deaminase n=1 Tax=Dethiosulfatibacter aminovorans DSM 17477 TaxID=1121476 RepID=A0A1M6HZ97_9FIRM|nr:Rid family detoxifying hydrolase [Dethiosulfatibacter aminovorans]SHJ27483.1 2-iminobutanoate/2-iminopropanoate deaminase [Dethiosulfatibacter aminovorans DSM 17477]